MTPAQLAEHYRRQAEVPIPQPPRPDGWGLACEAVRAEVKAKEQQEREERERDLDLPTLQARWDKRQQGINSGRDSAIRKAKERCRADEQTANDKANRESDELGPRPTLAELEAKL
jgi:hypothetical protein